MRLAGNAMALVVLIGGSAAMSAAHADTPEDEHIKRIVQGLLKEKDHKIEQLESRIRQLEQERKVAGVTAPNPPVAVALETEKAPPAKPEAEKTDVSVAGKLQALDKKIESIKETAASHGLAVSGFFDINAKTSNAADRTFTVGSVELDLDYAHDDHFGASTALLFNGDNGRGGVGGADFAVALVDYHLFNDRIPPRGRIFNNQGWHVQVGRFDLPFGTDYQNFASKDRVSITAPLTTSRIQNGGYNSEGVRTYGSWKMLNYSAFWTNAIYSNDGSTVGGRLGLSLGSNPYTVRHNNRDAVIQGIEFGVSHLSELDGGNRIRNTVYGADLGIGYGILRMQNEVMLLQAHQQVFLDADGNIVSIPTGNPYGKRHQLGYHSTLTADLESLLKQPVKLFARYGRWQPAQKLGLDYDGSTVAVNDVAMLSLGFNYKFSDYLRLKFEYDDTLGTWTAEHYFDKRVGIAQIVMAF